MTERLSDHSQRKWALILQSALVLSFSFYAGVTYQRMNVVEAATTTIVETVGNHDKKIISLEWQIRQTIETQARQTRVLEKLVNERHR